MSQQVPWLTGKILKMPPVIDIEKLKPGFDYLKKLKDEILKDAHGEDWLRTKVLSLEYDDGFSFESLIEINWRSWIYPKMPWKTSGGRWSKLPLFYESHLDFGRKTAIFVYSIQCTIDIYNVPFISIWILSTYNIQNSEYHGFVSILTPFCLDLTLFFRLICTPITTIDWISWERYGSIKEKQ